MAQITTVPQYEYYYSDSYDNYQQNYVDPGQISYQEIQNDYVQIDNQTAYSSPDGSYIQDDKQYVFYSENPYLYQETGESQEIINEPQQYYVENYDNDNESLKHNEAVQVQTQHIAKPTNSSRKRTAVEMNCNICGLFLRHPSKIQAHMRTHTGERPFQCEYCGKSFTQRTPYRCHVRRHIGDTPFQCSRCEKSFPNASSRKAHEMRVHERHQKNNDSAEFIGYVNGFKNENNETVKKEKYEPEMLTEIIDDVVSGKVKIENDEKFLSKPGRMPTLEICHICGLHLKYPSRIQQHMRSHSGIKPYLCEMCGQNFASPSTLKVHQGRFHTLDRPYACRWQCGKKFPARSHRNEHEKIVHSRIKRYQCGVSTCNKLFTRRLYLVKHLEKTHTTHPNQEEVKGYRVVAVPYEKHDGVIKVPENFDLTTAKIFADTDGIPYIVDVLGPIEDKLQRNPVLIEDALLQMLCSMTYPSKSPDSANTCSSSSSSILEFDDEDKLGQ